MASQQQLVDLLGAGDKELLIADLAARDPVA